MHILPKILDITLELADQYNIKFVRFPNEKFSGYMFRDLKSINRIAQMAAINHYCSKVKDKVSIKTDYFAGFYFGGNLSKQNLLTLINNLPANGTCELMCHPGFSDSSPNYSHLKYRQVEEMMALIDDEIADALKARNVEISSFQNLIP